MSNIRNWHSTATDNATLADGGWPEGMKPSDVNNQARDNMGAIRTWYEDAEWIDFGHSASPVSSATFVIDGDVTTQYHGGRRIKVVDSQGTVYGTISSVTYTGATSTGIYITPDSGGLSGSISLVSVGIISYVNTSMPDVTASAALYANTAQFAESASHAESSKFIIPQNITSTAGNSTTNISLSLGTTNDNDVFYVEGICTKNGDFSGTSQAIIVTPGNMVGTFINGLTSVSKTTFTYSDITGTTYYVSGLFVVSSGTAGSTMSASSDMTCNIRISAFKVRSGA